jgi:hypothetical protein
MLMMLMQQIHSSHSSVSSVSMLHWARLDWMSSHTPHAEGFFHVGMWNWGVLQYTATATTTYSGSDSFDTTTYLASWRDHTRTAGNSFDTTTHVAYQSTPGISFHTTTIWCSQDHMIKSTPNNSFNTSYVNVAHKQITWGCATLLTHNMCTILLFQR